MSSASRSDAATARTTSLRPLFLVALVCLGFFAFWLWDLGYPSLSGDESFVAILMKQPAGDILQRLNYDEPHPPAYYLLMRSWYLVVGGRPEYLVRFPSLLVGLVLLSLTYRLGREIGLRAPAALAATLALGLNPQVTTHVREARMYGPMIASLAFAALIALRFNRLPQRLAIGIAALACCLPLLTHYFNSLFVLALGVWGMLAFEGSVRRRWLLAQGVAWAVFAAWLLFMGHGFFNPTSLSEGKTWSFVLPPWDTLARLVTVGTFGYRDVPDPWLVVAGGAVLAGGWLAGSLRGDGRQRWLLVLGVAVPLVTYALLGWFKPLFHPKYMLPWLLFAALALGRLIDRRRWLGGGVLISLGILMALPTWRTVRLPYDPGFAMSRNEWLRTSHRQLSQFLVEYAGPKDTFGLGTPDAAHCYYSEYYFDRNLGCNLIPQFPTQSLDDMERQIGDLLAAHDVLWYLDFYNPAWDPHRNGDAALSQRAVNLGLEETEGGRLRLYTSADTVVRDQQQIAARLGDVAELEGVWVTQGSQLHVALVWRALAEQPAVSAKVFVHLIDAGGQMVAQEDGVPVRWTRPIETWHLNERVLDIYVLPLPPGARLNEWSLHVGLYDPDTLIRFPAYDRGLTRLPDDTVPVPLSAWASPTTGSAR